MLIPRLAAAFLCLASAAYGQPAPVDLPAQDKVLQSRLALFFIRPQEAVDGIRAELAASPNDSGFARISSCVKAYAAHQADSARIAAQMAEKVDKELCLKHPRSCVSHSRQESLKQTFSGALIGVLGAELGGQPKADTSERFRAYVQEVAATGSVARMATPELLPILEQVYFDASGQLATTILQTCAVPSKEKTPAPNMLWVWSGVAAGAALLMVALYRLFMRQKSGR